MSFLEVVDYKKKFGDNEVLKGISFSLEKGQVLAIIGSSGGGKTTLLRCLNFLERADEGKLLLDGEVLFDAADKKQNKEKSVREKRLHFGLVFQSFNLFPQYTVYGNIVLAQKLLAKRELKRIKAEYAAQLKDFPTDKKAEIRKEFKKKIVAFKNSQKEIIAQKLLTKREIDRIKAEYATRLKDVPPEKKAEVKKELKEKIAEIKSSQKDIVAQKLLAKRELKRIKAEYAAQLKNVPSEKKAEMKKEIKAKLADYKNGQKERIAEKTLSLLSRVGLSEKKDSYPYQLSGGQQQRVAIARALALNPDILCFDEPTSALDPELTGEVLKVIKGLKSSDSTMIVVTHEMDFARNVADHVIFIADGHIEEEGTPEQIFENPRSEKTRAFLKKSTEDNF